MFHVEQSTRRTPIRDGSQNPPKYRRKVVFSSRDMRVLIKCYRRANPWTLPRTLTVEKTPERHPWRRKNWLAIHGQQEGQALAQGARAGGPISKE